MPTTRSMKSLSSVVARSATVPKTPKPKRKAEDEESESPPQNSKKPRVLPPSVNTQSNSGNEDLPAALTFSFETAKQHLISVDSRFKGVFSKLPCRPFEHLERVDPFRTLATSILGQQISWLAARSIKHKFIRLYNPSLPEKPPTQDSDVAKESNEFFPSPSQVADTDITTLRSAGLSARKAEYIKDLASRFADGRLTSRKLSEVDDEKLAKLLIEVRGIGRWTVDMFAIFSLRRPDILPVGDLGVQRGVIRWFLSLHSRSDPVTISSKKLPKSLDNPSKSQDTLLDYSIKQPGNHEEGLATKACQPLPVRPRSGSTNYESSTLLHTPVTPVKARDIVTTPTSSEKIVPSVDSMPILPEPFTPSINKILNPEVGVETEIDGVDGDGGLPPLPEGLTVAVLRSRLNGKKKVKGALLSPKEMEEFTEPWRPYRSLGVYYMWALAEDTTTQRATFDVRDEALCIMAEIKLRERNK